MTDLKIPFAKYNNSLLSPEKAEEIKLYGESFICPIDGCNGKLKLTKSYQRKNNVKVSSFFSHISLISKEQELNHRNPGMTIVHQRCRDVFSKIKSITYIENRLEGIVSNNENQFTLNIKEIEFEKKQKSNNEKAWIPDIKCISDEGVEFAIEIAVTNFKKYKDFSKFSMPVLEINCKDFPIELDILNDNDVINFLNYRINNSYYSKWWLKNNKSPSNKANLYFLKKKKIIEGNKQEQKEKQCAIMQYISNKNETKTFPPSSLTIEEQYKNLVILDKQKSSKVTHKVSKILKTIVFLKENGVPKSVLDKTKELLIDIYCLEKTKKDL